METKGYTHIYDSIFETDQSLDKLFEEKIKQLGIEEIKELQSFIHEEAGKHFPKVKGEENAEYLEERLDMPYDKFSRFRLTTMLLTILSLGGIYSEKMYAKTAEFCNTFNGDEKKSVEVNFS